MRFAIILTARWAASDSESPEHRAELRADLALLRKHYSNKIDEIAMTFGVEQAMKAKEEVERTVVVPRDSLIGSAEDGREESDEGYKRLKLIKPGAGHILRTKMRHSRSRSGAFLLWR